MGRTSSSFQNFPSPLKLFRTDLNIFCPSRSSTGSQTGFIFAVYSIGSIAAIPFTGPINDLLGRRWGMFTGAMLIILGTCIQAPSTSIRMFIGGRFVLGFGVSFCSVSAPCYVSEMSHPRWRGTHTGLYNCMW